MSTGKNWAPVAWIIGISLMLVYELWAVINNIPGDTLSETVWAMNTHPMIPFVVGVICGHFFWQSKSK